MDTKSGYPMRLCRDGIERPIPPRDTDEQRRKKFFAALVPYRNDCLVFRRALGGSAGYRGQFSYHGKTWMPHVLAYVLEYGEIEAGKNVCHTCDEGRCCNPRHLFAGTQLENMRDMISKGRARHPAGQDHQRARLTPNQVIEIRRRMATRKFGDAARIAREFGISLSEPFHILSRKTWRTIP